MSNKVKIIGIILIVLLAASLIGLALVTYKFVTLSNAAKNNSNNVYTLLIVEDKADDFYYRYETKETREMQTLEDILKSEEVSKDLKINYLPEVSGYGVAIDSINGYGNFKTNNWEIHSPTDYDCSQMNENYCEAGISNLYMKDSNIYELILPQ